MRFDELARMIGGASKKMIAERLRQLETQGVSTRRQTGAAPVCIHDEVTPPGQTALGLVDERRRSSATRPDSAFREG